MKLIQDNSQKEYVIKCNKCDSKFSFKIEDMIEYSHGYTYVKCPACTHLIYVRKTKFGYKRGF